MSKNYKNKKRNISIEVERFRNGVFNVDVYEIINNDMGYTKMIDNYTNIHRKKFKKLFRKYINRILRLKYEYIDIDYLG